MQPGRAIIQRPQLGQHPLCLAQCIAQQDRRLAALFAFAAPRHDLRSDCRRVRPAVDRQGEGCLGDERIAGHHFERRAGRVWLALVVAGGHPDLPPVVDAHLRGPSTWPAGCSDTCTRPRRNRVPSACACTGTSPGRQRRIGRLPSLQWYSPMPGRAWSPWPWVMTARGTGRRDRCGSRPQRSTAPPVATPPDRHCLPCHHCGLRLVHGVRTGLNTGLAGHAAQSGRTLLAAGWTG